MFIGHYAVGFAAKKGAPGLSLGVLLAAPQLVPVWGWWIGRHREPA